MVMLYFNLCALFVLFVAVFITAFALGSSRSSVSIELLPFNLASFIHMPGVFKCTFWANKQLLLCCNLKQQQQQQSMKIPLQSLAKATRLVMMMMMMTVIVYGGKKRETTTILQWAPFLYFIFRSFFFFISSSHWHLSALRCNAQPNIKRLIHAEPLVRFLFSCLLWGITLSHRLCWHEYE